MKRILVCLDASPRASLALERATAIARATGAKLTLLRVVGLPHGTVLPSEALSMSPNELVELWRRDAERDLESIRAALPPNLAEAAVARRRMAPQRAAAVAWPSAGSPLERRPSSSG